jgi:hypothetical protein
MPWQALLPENPQLSGNGSGSEAEVFPAEIAVVRQ